MAAYHFCKHVTGYEIDTDRYKILLNNIKNFKKEFDNHSRIEAFCDNCDKIIVAETANKFFFFNPFHLKVYIRVIESIKTSLEKNHRNIYLFLYKPQIDTIKHIDSFDYFKKSKRNDVTKIQSMM